MHKSEELAWAAGFFDGEGSVGSYASGGSFYKGKRRTYLKVSIANTDKSLLTKFQTIIGFGTIDGPYKSKNPKWSPRYMYRSNGFVEVEKLFELLRPYLGEAKTKDFETAINQTTAQRRHGGLVDAPSSNLGG